jgi:hypothetical protein
MKMDLEILYKNFNWIRLAQDMDQKEAHMNKVMHLRVP